MEITAEWSYKVEGLNIGMLRRKLTVRDAWSAACCSNGSQLSEDSLGLKLLTCQQLRPNLSLASRTLGV